MAALFRNGYFYVLAAAFFSSAWVLDTFYQKASLSNSVAMALFVTVMIGCMALFTWKVKSPSIVIKQPEREALLLLLLSNLRAALLSGACFGGMMLITTPGGKYLLGLEQSAGELTAGLAVSFLVAFLFAGWSRPHYLPSSIPAL
ncbi:hypothetical protein [Paenibacillus dendritiformis]|uniref:Uncharacterized protein n=1 Tax=Paenibacillus dendritiformis C454 TaxID=1131935 RepID=H3SP30_9BACL|nr:hypothetical protein [Paenibacillus dendritiformis]EHQ59186.1 hypothetical protein PDENDC454_26693 [Paenibacillus dendritiformis C454]CAH8771129.1 hypothetical protein H7S4_003864 [Paenibacillus dendritiformis]